MQRRTFLSASAGAALALGPGFWRSALGQPAVAGSGPYGPPGSVDANGIRLPAGFTSRVIARAGETVPGSSYTWHVSPDGAATFLTPDAGWYYVCNSETVGNGGVGAIHFAPDGSIVDAYRILSGTNANCAGGPTPWGTWLSCEEYDFSGELPDEFLADPGSLSAGMVWECDPTQPGQGIPRPAMGRFSHEAAAVDPESGRVFLTEDQGDGKIYAFHPVTPGDLSDGSLFALVVDPENITAHEHGYGPFPVSWVPVPDPLGVAGSTRSQVPEAARFQRGEGMWIDSGVVYFATTGDERIWALTLGRNGSSDSLETLYHGRDPSRWPQDATKAPLWDPDNITVSPHGHIFASEDSGDLRISVITPPDADDQRVIAPFLQLDDAQHDGSELTGPCFDPAGSRLYFSSQRGGPRGLGITYEISGPFPGPAHSVNGSPGQGQGQGQGRGSPANRPPDGRGPGNRPSADRGRR